MTPKDFVAQETGVIPGESYELSFDQLGLPKGTHEKMRNQIGIKTTMTEFFKAAKRRNRQQNPIAPNQADIVNWILYDRFQFAPGTTVPNNFKFFVQPIGTNGKTKIDTNMDQVQRLPDPLWFNTTGIGFYFSNTTNPIDAQGFLDTEYMEYWVGQKVYLEGPIQCFPAGAGLYGAVTGDTQFAIEQNGQARIDNVFDVRLPAGIHLGVDAANNPIVTDGLIGITILQGQQFKVELNAPLGGVALQPASSSPFPGGGLTIMCYLYGILSRGVQ